MPTRKSVAIIYIYIYIYIYISAHWHKGYSVHQYSRRTGFNPKSCHTKDSKMVLDTSLLNTQHYKIWIKGKWINIGKRVAPSHTPRCSS